MTDLVNIKLKAIQGLLTGDDIYKVGVFPDMTVDNMGIEDFPSDEEIETAYLAEKAEYDALEYARKRQEEYPSLPEQLDEIYHNGVASWKAVIKVTKDKYPKG